MSFTFDLNTLLNTLLSVAIGSAVTWLVARVYYRRAALELERESRERADSPRSAYAGSRKPA